MQFDLDRRLGCVLLALTLGAACANPEATDAGRPDAEPLPDSGVVTDAGFPPDAGEVPRDGGFRISSTNLAPAAGEAASPRHHLTGRLGASDPEPAQSSSYRLRGRLLPAGARPRGP